MNSKTVLAAALLGALAVTATSARAADPLPSWNEGPAKQSIIAFVTKVTTAGSPEFVPVPERIATFANDGGLGAGRPVGRAADVFPGVVHLRPHQGPRAAAPGVEGQGAVRLRARGRREGRAGRRRARADGDGDGHPRRHDDRGVRDDREGLARHGKASGDQTPRHREGLPAYARGARLPAGGRVLDPT